MKLELTPTQYAYVQSEAVVVAIIGGMGEGKTLSSIAALLYHAKRNKKPIHCAILRDTLENLKIATVRSIKEVLGKLVVFKNDYKEMTIKTNPIITADLFGIDDDASLSKFQGTEYALIWLEEPAPMVDRANAGLSEAVFNAALARCVRQKDRIPRLQISMNPSDTEHWTYKRLIEEDDIDKENPLVTKEVFFIPPGENIYLTDLQRQAMKRAFKGDAAAYARYIENRFAIAYRGERVCPDYNMNIHLAKTPLAPIEGLVGFRSWDAWHNPACVIGQITPNGRLIFLDCLAGSNMDIKTFAESYVKPLMFSKRWKDKCRAWRDIGDVSMRTPDQSNIFSSPAKIIEQMFGTFFEPGPKLWSTIKTRLGLAFNSNVAGEPKILINPELKNLHNALAGGWHYATDRSGNIRKDVPEKDKHSHIGDAFANAVSVLLPLENKSFDYSKFKAINQRQLSRAAGYGIV